MGGTFTGTLAATGPSLGCGIDFGGWSAFFSIVTALKRQGVLKSEGNNLVLTEGDPIPYVEPMLPKPYVKVRRQLVDLFDGEQVTPQNVWIWLDPRGDMEFLVILPNEMAEMVSAAGRAGLVDGGFFCARGKVPAEALGRASTLSKEFACVLAGGARQVLYIEFDTATKEREEKYFRHNGLMFSYARFLYLDDGFVYQEKEDGSLLRRHHVGKFDAPGVRAKLAADNKVVIDYTPEREAALEALRQRLVMAAADLRRILTADDFVAVIDNNGPRLLAIGSTSKEPT